VDSGMTNREPWPLCGYGRLGLCCSACLLGPCRLTPFDELPDRGRCGRDRDQLVAFNLHQAVAIEALQAIRSLGTNKSSGPSERLRALFFEGAFPHLKEFGIPPQSLMAFFFDQLERSGEVEEILTRALCLSLVPLLSQALAHQIFQEGMKRDEMPALPFNGSAPLIILVTEKESPGEAWVTRMGQAFHDHYGKEAQIISASGIGIFPEIGRRIYQDRHLPVALTKTLAIISSLSLSTVLMPLTLGFPVVSYPSLPVHGGPKVEAFFSKGILRRFGGQYISGREDLSLPAVLEEMRWTTHPI